MWDGLKRFAGSVAADFLTDEQRARAAGLAKRAQETAKAAAEQAGAAARVAGEKAVEAHGKWREAQAAAEAARREAEAAEAGRQRELADQHGLKAPLTYELKKSLGLDLDWWEQANQKTRAEEQPPGEWFTPFGWEMRLPRWLNASDLFFTGDRPCRVLETGIMNNGGRSWIRWQLQPRFTLNAATWYFESLVIRALFERWKRGLPVLDNRNQPCRPDFTEEGYPIIDQSEDEDGTVTALIALPDPDLCTSEDLEAFTKLLGRYIYTPWKGRFCKEAAQPPGAWGPKKSQLAGYSIGRPKVMPWVLKRADPDRNPYAPKSIVHGSAQWAWRTELAEADMIDLDEPERLTGHSFLGRSVYHFPNGEAAMNHLTCWGGEGHRLIVGPPGSGKFTSAIAPLLLWSGDRDSAFVLDVKNGEATEKTAAHRASLGPVTVLDPFGITGRPSGGINPIDLLREDGPRLVATAERIAEAMFVPSNSSDQHWDQAAKKMLAALLMHIGTSPTYAEEERNLKTLRNIVREHIPDEVLCAMRANGAGDGEVAAEAKAMLAAKESGSDKYSFSVIASLNVNIGFLKVPEILAATETTTFDPRELKERVSTLYVVVPDHQLATVSRWVRLIYCYVMEQLRETKGGTHVHVVLDEFPALGKFERVAQDMAQTRSLGVHMHVVVQTFQQLLDTYGKGWERFQGTSAMTHILGVRDNFTAEQVSKMLGTTTVKTSNQSQTRGNSGGSQSEGSAYSGRRLMTPDELMAMPWERCLAVVGGMYPLRLEKVGYLAAKVAPEMPMA
jgi:type IV secretion system protein VirD4